MPMDYRGRGLRTPMHTAAVTATRRRLQPFMAHPLRPNETLIGLRLNVGAWLNQGVKLGIHQPIGLEVGVWKVPVSALGDQFIDLIAGGAEDAAHRTDPIQVQTVNLPGPLAEQGHLDGTALGTKPRPWAGEVGQDAVPADADDARYARWVSASTWAVARAFYDLELGEHSSAADRDDFTLHDEAPLLADMIRGATYSGITAGQDGIDTIPSGTTGTSAYETSISQWAEVLAVMASPDRTYAEYLQAFGVNPSRVRSLPEPYLYRRGMLAPWGSPQMWHFGANWSSDNDSSADFVVNAPEYNDSYGQYVRQMAPTIATTPDRGVAFAGDRMGLVRLGTQFRLKRRRRMIVDEPSVLLGCFAWWPVMTRESQYAHHMDMSQMMHAAHWGVPTGGIDETDFLAANTLMDAAAAGTQEGEADADITGGLRAFNLLNLYLHGDAFCNDVNRFGLYGPFDTILEEAGDSGINDLERVVDFHAMAKLAIATDLVT